MLKIVYSMFIFSLLACGSGSENVMDKRTMDENTVNTSEEGFAIASLPDKAGVYGDSIGVGLFSDTTLGNTITNNSHPDLIDMFNTLLRNFFFNPSAAVTNFLNDLALHYKSLQVNAFRDSATDLLGEDAIITNDAELAARLDDLVQGFQSGELVPQQLNYITIGANDFCSSSYNINEMQSKLIDLRNILESESFKDSKFVIVPPPNIPGLFDITENHSLSIGRTSYRCSAAVDLFEFCPRSGSMTSAEYFSLVSLYESEFADSKNIAIASLADLSIEESDIAADCFHPSRAGHEKISANISKTAESLIKSRFSKKIRKAGTDQCLYFMHRVSGLNLGSCDEAPRYKWDLLFDPQGSQKYVIKNNLTEKCFFTRGEGVDLYQDSACSYENSRMAFNLIPNSNGSFTLKSGEGLCVNSTPDGRWNEIQSLGCDDAESFDWVID